ncbi:MAG: hypothetical protein HYU57_04465, partial [Micavibrio aeruginosavorus]|nr:hypothetical protein [Micavibrio aeruginosavorus]
SAWTGGTVNHDIFWFYTGYQRLTSGGTLLRDFYELNPPLTVFFYAPAFFLTAQDVLPLERSILLYGLALIGLSVAATYRILRRWPDLGGDRAALVCLLLFFAATIMVGPDFGQRDHFAALGAVPLACLLAGRNWGHAAPPRWLALAVLVAGTLTLLLKPHYGLLPAFLMVHRAWGQRRLSALWDGDFLVMAATAGVYALTTPALFGDYLKVIVPDAIALYAGHGANFNTLDVVFYSYLGLFLMALTFHPRLNGMVREARMFVILGLLALCAYFIMNKGYTYHLIPAETFFLLAMGLLASPILQVAGWRGPVSLAWQAAVFSLIVTFMPHPYLPSPQTVRAQPMTRMVAECGENCRFLVMGGTVRMIQLVSYYSGKEHASRFAKFWFQGLRAEERKRPGDPALLALRQRIAAMIAEDLARYRPDLVFVCNDHADYIPYLSVHPGFAEEMRHYKAAGTVASHKAVYFLRKPQKHGDFYPCDLYKRKAS